jgi:hypothetical protein
MMRRLGFVLLMAIALHGCVTDEGLTGTGPVTLTNSEKAFLDKWWNGSVDRDPLYYFLVRGGSAYSDLLS